MREGWRLSPHVAAGLKEEPKIRESIHTKPYIPLNVCCSLSPAQAKFTLRTPLCWAAVPPLQESACCVRVELLSCRQDGGCDRRGPDQREVSRLCKGLPGADRVPDLGPSGRRWLLLSTALLFWFGEGETGAVRVAVGEGGVGVALRGLAELRLVGASSSASVSSMRGIWGSESSIRNSGWVMKLWMDVRDSGFSSPS